ncbi:hypothetical protein C1G86_1050 [Dehalococcoides mccartyi]|uniref:Uncharacterized protein n=2 Tax=Dehalococcoides mccartyi TaxID=61435 RepID=A0A328ESG9_9CHLR|nr:hypothetical protein C1G87_1022 [Dehalococcoides mccartyi]RAL70483.1 hypothetical protein C1G86_1050 [Dehalococcoides mccartyi]CAI83180.1 hypothetical protein cbdbA1078 [Dehalococcoides mccartyi CBDB1]
MTQTHFSKFAGSYLNILSHFSNFIPECQSYLPQISENNPRRRGIEPLTNPYTFQAP